MHKSNESKRDNILRIKKFLKDYKALKPSRYSSNDIKKLTTHFKDKLGQGWNRVQRKAFQCSSGHSKDP